MVRAGKDLAPITDGVFPEAKEFVLGYWIVDVEVAERAYEIAARISGGAWPRGNTLSMPIEVRQIMSGLPRNCRDASLDDRSEHLLRELAPQVLGVVIRRFRDFSDAEDAVQEALIAAALQWPKEGIPDNPRGWLIQVASGA